MALLTFGAGDREPPARHPPVPAEAVAAPSASERAERDERFLADARRALERDPTAALELLAAIDPGGPASGAARVLAAEAVRRGVSARVMQGHRSWIGAVDVSADGAFAVSGGGDGSLRLWNLATGVATPLPGHDGAVLATVISPDGRWIASAGADTTVRVWNVRRKESFVLVGHAGWVDRLCFSPDSRRLLSAGRDRVVRLWHVDDRPALARELTGHRGRIVGVSFARGDRLVVSASADRTLRVWDRRSGRGRSLRGHAAPVAAMAVSAEGAVVSGDEIGVVRAWTPSSGASAVRASLGTPITALAFAGDAIVAGTGDGALWRVPSGGEAIRLHSRAAAVSSVAVLAGHRVTAGYDDGVVVALTDVGVRELRGHEGTVRALASSGGRLVSAAEDGDLRVWRIDRGDRVVHGEERLVAMAATDGGVIAVDVAGAVYRVDPAGERVVGTASGRPVSVAVSTGGMIAVGRGDGAIAIVGSEARALEAHRGPVIGLVFGRDDGILISAGDDGVVRGWDPASGLEAWRVALGSAVTWLGRSPVGMIATTWEGRAFAIDENGRAVGLAPSLDDVAAAAAISADGRHLAVASMGGEVQLVDLESGASTRVRGHKGAIGAVAFSADGSRLATGGAHGTARIWSVEGGALRALGDVHGGDGEIVALAFTEDGRGLITGATGGAVRVWDPESGAHCELRGHVGDVQAIVITTGSVVSLARSGELIWWREALPRWPRG